MATRLFYLCTGTLILALLPWSHAGCKEDLQQDSNVLECVMGFMGFMTNMNMGASINQSDVFISMCSKEGQAAFACLFKYMQQCPELLQQPDGSNPMDNFQQIPGFDLSTFMGEGGFEAACAMLVGPCSKVKECFDMPQEGQMRKREVQASMNYYLLFQMQTAQMCGEMKKQMTCALDALEQCPKTVVDLVEKQFEKALEMALPDAPGILSFKDTKAFMQNECSKVPAGFSQDQCITRIVTSQNFTDCTKGAYSQYSEERTCSVYDESLPCIEEQLRPECSNTTADFLIRNTHVIFPGIPSDCQKYSSGSDVMAAPSLLLLLLPLLLSITLFKN